MAKLGTITGNLGKVGSFVGGSGVISGVARGVLGSVLSQGIGVATGLQEKFSWTSVATAGVISGAAAALSGLLPGKAETFMLPNEQGGLSQVRIPASDWNVAASSLGGAIAGAATRSLIKGTSFGDNLMAVLPDVIGTTIGNFAARGINAMAQRATQGREAEAAAPPQAPPSTTVGAPATSVAPSATTGPTTACVAGGTSTVTVPVGWPPEICGKALQSAMHNVAPVTYEKIRIQPTGTTDPNLAVPIKIGRVTGSAVDRQFIIDSLSHLSRDELRYIKRRDLRFVATSTNVTEYMPGLQGYRPRGYTQLEAGAPPLWDNRGGVYNSDRRVVVVARNPMFSSYTSDRVLHELGHAFDDLLPHSGFSMRSSMPDFGTAYASATSATTGQAFQPRPHPEYYFRSDQNPAYLSETFAESFAQSHVPANNFLTHRPPLRAYWQTMIWPH